MIISYPTMPPSRNNGMYTEAEMRAYADATCAMRSPTVLDKPAAEDRAAFETWARSMQVLIRLSRHGDEYESAFAQVAWAAWLAKGAATVWQVPIEPQFPKGMTSINARLSFGHGWKECERAHGIADAKAAAKGS